MRAPDKNPNADPETFKLISDAYDVLSDAELRAVYDRDGLAAVQACIRREAHKRHDYFTHLFGNDFFEDNVPSAPPPAAASLSNTASRNSATRAQPPVDAPSRSSTPGLRVRSRGADVVHEYYVTLEELYAGATMQVELQRVAACRNCADGGVTPCGRCVEPRDDASLAPPSSTTATTTTSSMHFADAASVEAPAQRPWQFVNENAVQSSASMAGATTTCGSCRRTRVPHHQAAAAAASQCGACRGARFVNERTTHELRIERGARDGDVVVVRGAGDLPHADAEPGDVLLTLRQLPHPRFARVGDDLVIAHKIDLAAALCGGAIVVEHLDGRRLLLRWDARCAPQHRLVVPNEGMQASVLVVSLD